MTTQTQLKAALTHVIEEVFGFKDQDHPLRKALTAEGIDTLYDMLTMPTTDIDALAYDDSGTERPVPKGYRNLIKVYKDYVIHCDGQGSTITDHTQVSKLEFDQFRGNPAYIAGGSSKLSAVVPAPSQTQPHTSHASDIDNYKKGIKRDPTSFPTLKDECYQDSWHKKFVTVISAQDLDNVIDKNYTPPDQSSAEIFELQKKFVYHVLYDKVLTSKGKAILRKHFKTKDAQKVYAELLKHHTASAAANISAREIQIYFTTVKLGDGKFRGSTEAFLDHLNSQFDLYEELTGVTIDDKQRMQHVSRAVSTVPKLAAIETTAELLETNTGKSFGFSDYFALLHAAAVRYDDALKVRGKRMVYSHDVLLDQGGQYDFSDNEQWGSYEANLHHLLTSNEPTYDDDDSSYAETCTSSRDHGQSPPSFRSAYPVTRSHTRRGSHRPPPRQSTKSQSGRPPPEPPPVGPRSVQHKEPDYTTFRRFFAWAKPDAIR